MASTTVLSQWQNIARLIWILQVIFKSSVVSSANPASSRDNEIVQDISVISKYWGNLKPYAENPENQFGIKDTGLPKECQVEQVQLIHRHGARYPPSSELRVITEFTAKVTTRDAGENFRGSLSFLNTWSLRTTQDALVATGASMAYTSGTDFWNKYGRLLYNAIPGQTSYNATGQAKPLLRCNTLPRVYDTARAWAEGFFGPYNATSKYSLLPIQFASSQNNTLASFLSCSNFVKPTSGIVQSQGSLEALVPLYLGNALERFLKYTPQAVNLTVEDVFAMQELCVYEYVALGSSDFCKLFTLIEWKRYNYVLDSYYYRYGSFGSTSSRSIGLGLLQEVLARLEHKYINSSQSSVNYTLDSDPATFPLDQKFYADFTHDFQIWGILTAMSLDYFRQPLPLSFPAPANRHFRLTDVTPYTARLIVEKIGCSSPRPKVRKDTVTEYTNSQYGYSSSSASHKFVRIRLNNAILPLNTIRGGKCKIARRTDGLCPLKNFIDSQANAAELANYQTVCFGQFTFNSSNFNGDGTYFP